MPALDGQVGFPYRLVAPRARNPGARAWTGRPHHETPTVDGDVQPTSREPTPRVTPGQPTLSGSRKGQVMTDTSPATTGAMVDGWTSGLTTQGELKSALV